MYLFIYLEITLSYKLFLTGLLDLEEEGILNYNSTLTTRTSNYLNLATYFLLSLLHEVWQIIIKEKIKNLIIL